MEVRVVTEEPVKKEDNLINKVIIMSQKTWKNTTNNNSIGRRWRRRIHLPSGWVVESLMRLFDEEMKKTEKKIFVIEKYIQDDLVDVIVLPKQEHKINKNQHDIQNQKLHKWYKQRISKKRV